MYLDNYKFQHAVLVQINASSPTQWYCTDLLYSFPLSSQIQIILRLTEQQVNHGT